jgi:hypothetical protein
VRTRENGAWKAREKPVVLVGDGAGKDIVAGEKVGVVHVERRELVLVFPSLFPDAHALRLALMKSTSFTPLCTALHGL